MNIFAPPAHTAHTYKREPERERERERELFTLLCLLVLSLSTLLCKLHVSARLCVLVFALKDPPALSLSLSVTTVGGGEKATTRTSEGRIFRVVGGDYLRELSLGRALERRNLL
jgi:hypothetical protein